MFIYRFQEEKSESSEDSPGKISCNPAVAGAACCNSGCCYRPCYTYCYNPCTGCYYWRKKCCCCNACNGCCNNGGSCPLPKPSPIPGPMSGPTASPSAKNKVPTDSGKGTNSGSSSDQRSSAGAASAFQPEVQELYNQWMGFQQQAIFPP